MPSAAEADASIAASDRRITSDKLRQLEGRSIIYTNAWNQTFPAIVLRAGITYQRKPAILLGLITKSEHVRTDTGIEIRGHTVLVDDRHIIAQLLD